MSSERDLDYAKDYFGHLIKTVIRLEKEVNELKQKVANLKP
jgi:hypothetical protein